MIGMIGMIGLDFRMPFPLMGLSSARHCSHTSTSAFASQKLALRMMEANHFPIPYSIVLLFVQKHSDTSIRLL